MNPRYRCPYCRTTNTRYRSTQGSHICNRCGHQWAPMTVETVTPRRKTAKRIGWTLTVIGVLGTIGGAPIFLFFTFLAWLYFGFVVWKERKQVGSESIGSEALSDANQPYFCRNRMCGQELSDDEEYCTACGAARERPLTTYQFRTCGSCGRELSQETEFCPGCGTQVLK